VTRSAVPRLLPTTWIARSRRRRRVRGLAARAGAEAGEILYRFANLLMEEKDEFTELMSHEMAR